MTKKVSFFLLCNFAFLFVVKAFRPIGHVLLKNEIVASLPEGNIFKKAMLKHPEVAAWGAVAPDLAYSIDFSKTWRKGWKHQMKNSWQMADMAHYNAIGTFITNLIKEAYETKDELFFAFVGGWITHVAGDFASHGIYVKPEAGYYIGYEKGRDLHGKLEKMADAYLYKKYAKKYCYSCDTFCPQTYWKAFFGVKPIYQPSEYCLINDMIGGSVQNSFNKVYKQTFQLDSAEVNLVDLAYTYYRAVGLGLGKFTGGKFKQYTNKQAEILINDKKHNRKNLIDSAFKMGIDSGTSYLTRAANKKYDFGNNWNLDIGENGSPTYLIRIDVGNKKNARTKNNVFVTFKNKEDTPGERIRLTTNFMFLKFAFYHKDSYIYAVYLGGPFGELADAWKPDKLKEIILETRIRWVNVYPNYLRAKKVTIYYEGKELATKVPESGDSLVVIKNWRWAKTRIKL